MFNKHTANAAYWPCWFCKLMGAVKIHHLQNGVPVHVHASCHDEYHAAERKAVEIKEAGK